MGFTDWVILVIFMMIWVKMVKTCCFEKYEDLKITEMFKTFLEK